MWLDEYHSRLTTEEKHTPGLILLQDDTEGFLQQNPGKLNLIPCELDLSSTPFCYIETIITYEIELLPSGKKIGLNFMDDYDFTAPYILDAITNSPTGHQLKTQAK